MRKLLILDFETTGVDASKHAPIEMGFILMKGNSILHKQSVKIRPYDEAEIDPRALKHNGLTPSDLLSEDRVTCEEAINILLTEVSKHIDIIDRGDNFTIMAYNAPFDISFLEVMLARVNKSFFTYFNYHTVDPLTILRVLRYEGLINIGSLKLTEVYKAIIGSALDDAHSALADCAACKLVYDYIRTKYIVPGRV